MAHKFPFPVLLFYSIEVPACRDLSPCRLDETCSEAAQSVVGVRYSSSGDHALCLCSGGGKTRCLAVDG